MFSAKIILTALAFVAVSSATPALTAAVVATAAVMPTAAAMPTPLAAPTITTCSGSLNPPNGCVTIPVVSDQCINFTGGLSFLNKEVSNAEVPAGFVCTFFEDFGCLNGGVNDHDVAILTGGTWDMFNVHGIASNQNFNDLTSSISCSPV
ncbi:hypothetical protein FB451DRAFT_1557824 [Mycena latifolia]|nr:hypothetical protein FB451DRAFT_1557824 [Mycena latifolia]